MNYHLDSDIEAFVINEISNFIKDNLQLLLRFNNYNMRYIKEYCIENDGNLSPVPYDVLLYMTKHSINALLSEQYLYDFRDLE